MFISIESLRIQVACFISIRACSGVVAGRLKSLLALELATDPSVGPPHRENAHTSFLLEDGHRLPRTMLVLRRALSSASLSTVHYPRALKRTLQIRLGCCATSTRRR